MPYKDYASYRQLVGKKKTVLVGGCFDLLHYGHLYFLQQAKEEGDLLIVALESDEFIEKRKNRKPVHTQKQRAEILSHIDLVDVVLLLPFFKTDAQYYQLTKTVSPDVILITKTHPHLERRKKQAALIKAKVVEIDLLHEFSSSNIVRYATVFGD
ncbi:hypothetical protein A2334_04795 [Candidatus Roizmanbacteria bacterium RIFOXYB2_FULL_38_10]|uniref:Cytidyltransferase-like domain-containing protein n=1 Tax=Candidatus Roizmanbacteria bacterium RIFOXYD1_FULL_38_12 TaxID=1802093 RepID=A0A1F7L2G5_9BACT|nr:MAG: hypothetical protein A3K47_00895 [Candidatus Roizmanbacteria bacterium RIFOXYA2_FULL_38_14]OGK64327.1 MAG: hypothetical protein A3K27_00895 [Candidatus Roizmanbacteria bacterium RIFOXYA1_FULL_37_12]OGK66173.1 MAG: hypothetical protein A3K38_00895 [Candidatus Roizmanbacteria bacterium RIFOXYB1_FULL_40_23]OGK68838.1 MAG: hypothetical protein A2334_04795 [Candidatus Roizmanbacteria bacterium RIFOXYB2_FULL_38_10]OGK70578.1 MAG: hypothetical protein A3K21_00900 [Candidatus Roizmanbacteria ba